MSVELAAARLEDAIFAPTDLAKAMSNAGEALGFDHFALVHSNLHELNVIATPNSLESLREYTSGGWLDADYRAGTIANTPIGHLYLDHIAVSHDQRLQSEIYHRYYVPHRMAHFAGWRHTLADSTWIFSLARAESRGPVTEAEANALKQLMPYANRALVTAYQSRRAFADGLSNLAERTTSGVIIIDHQGRVTHATPQARKSFNGDFDVRNDQLWAAHPTSMAALENLTEIARRAAPAPVMKSCVIRRREGGWPILLRPFPVRTEGLDGLPGAKIMITIIDRSVTAEIAVDDLRMLFGLSVAEATVAAQLANGMDPQDLADARGVKIGTIRTQIRHLFDKMKINRIGDLVRLVNTLSRID